MEKKIIVKCGACREVSVLTEWKEATIKNDRFAGGCPNCKGEFYDIISE